MSTGAQVTGNSQRLMVADVLDVAYPALRLSRSIPWWRGGGAAIVRERTKRGKAGTVSKRKKTGGHGNQT
jgi:hypothetical protein